MKKKESFLPQEFENIKNISLVFLGIGLTMFVLNITSYLSFLPAEFNVYLFYTSLISSAFIIGFSSYLLYEVD
jgi:hypothetical protein